MGGGNGMMERGRTVRRAPDDDDCITIPETALNR